MYLLICLLFVLLGIKTIKPRIFWTPGKCFHTEPPFWSHMFKLMKYFTVMYTFQSYVSMLHWAHHVNLILYTLSTCTCAQNKVFAVKTQLSDPFPSGLFACSISFGSVILHYTLLPARFWELSCPHCLKVSSMFTDTFCAIYQDLFLP